jgi:hypothetical protein
MKTFVNTTMTKQEIEDKLPHIRTCTRISVDEKEALKSSLAQLGSGIKLTGNLKKKFEEMVLCKKT